MNIVDGVYTIGSTPGADQIAVTVTGNRIKILGVLSSPKYFTVSDDTGSQAGRSTTMTTSSGLSAATTGRQRKICLMTLITRSTGMIAQKETVN